MSELVTVYVALLDEGTPVWRPARAQPIGAGYRLIGPEHDRADERWQFEVGETVRCERRHLSEGDVLVAVAPLGHAGASA